MFFHFLQLGQCLRKVSSYSHHKDEKAKGKKIKGNYGHIGEVDANSNVLIPQTEKSVKHFGEKRHDNTTNCKINLDEESPKWMPLFYSTVSNSYLMPERKAATYLSESSKTRNKPNYAKLRKFNDDNNYDVNPRYLDLSNKRNGEIIAMCPGTRIKVTKSISQQVRCINGNTLTIDGKTIPDKKKDIEPPDTVKFSDLSCAMSIKESILPTQETCGPASGRGRVIHIGWKNENSEPGSSFMAQITVCHDQDQEHTYYTNHTLYGSFINSKDVSKSHHVPFKEGGIQFYASSSAAKAYKISSQKKLFNELGPEFKGRSNIFIPGMLLFLSFVVINIIL